MKIINDDFEVGRRYVGMVNGAELIVEKIHRGQIHFRDEKSGKVFVTGAENAKRLLLEQVDE